MVFRMLMAASTALTPQEAYYWTWSRFPAISYYDHPPLISHTIWITTHVFGSTVFGVKMAAVAWSLGWNVLWLRLVQDMFADHRLTFWSLLALNSTVLYELYGIGPTPDGPLLFGWIGTVWAVWHASRAASGGWWAMAGVFLGIALLGKYSAILLLPVTAGYLLLTRRARHWLAHPGPWMALALALLLFSPVLLWNAQHGWASFSFQSSRRLGEMAEIRPRFFLLLAATQTLLLTPWAMALSLKAGWTTARRVLSPVADSASTLLWCSAMVPLAVFGAASFMVNGKLNWLIPAWWSLIVLGLRQGLSSPAGARRRVGLASSLVLLAATSALVIQEDLKLPGDLNVASGWRQAGARIDELVSAERASGRRAFVFSPNYKISSLIWMHRPSQERTYSSDIWGAKALQYDHFPRNEDLRGATGFLVVSDQSQSRVDMSQVSRLFQSMQWVESLETKSEGEIVRRIQIWRAENYSGAPRSIPADTGAHTGN